MITLFAVAIVQVPATDVLALFGLDYQSLL